ncbi:hypothetical protein ACQR5T_07300 [Xanthomonas oryzae pv. oryzicola]|uniref:hypothetical protein n=1 Tax=Xanthomonas oryzae TaxID=347 RepID=UPI00103526B8|nr:hypothetical protein [Xanthomonas oryzae]QBH05564.1 hypothetical protein EYC57_22555 [Xanthomonas oryzae]
MNKLSDNWSPIGKHRAIEAGRYAVFSIKIKNLYQQRWLGAGNAMSRYNSLEKGALVAKLNAETQPDETDQHSMANRKCQFQ